MTYLDILFMKNNERQNKYGIAVANVNFFYVLKTLIEKNHEMTFFRQKFCQYSGDNIHSFCN